MKGKTGAGRRDSLVTFDVALGFFESQEHLYYTTVGPRHCFLLALVLLPSSPPALPGRQERPAGQPGTAGSAEG